ncbi:unnamed protein product [Lactuca virosa]|uniref:Uncharacterized protein n=1 Tax=Lactuca virosa TaxID=75947 RepID=A0AAU9PH60_9ASTR|nr:unnamed protein product [Lactuca virosa]
MADEAVGEPSKTPHSPIRPMVSLETVNTLITPPPQKISLVSEVPPSGGPSPSLTTAAPSVTIHIPIPTLNSVTPPLFPNDDRPNPPISPSILLFFPSIGGLNNAGYNFLPPPIHTPNEQRQTTLITPPLNGMPPLTTPTNNTANGPSVAFQGQNHPPLVTEAMPAPPFMPY